VLLEAICTHETLVSTQYIEVDYDRYRTVRAFPVGNLPRILCRAKPRASRFPRLHLVSINILCRSKALATGLLLYWRYSENYICISETYE